MKPETLNRRLDFYAALDWSKTLAVLRKETGVSTVTLMKYRDMLGIAARPRGRVAAEKWHAVDWEEQDAVIARSMGVSRERVRQMRRALGMPDSKYHHAQSLGNSAKRWLVDNADLSGEVTANEVAERSGCHQGVVRAVAKLHGFRLKPDPYHQPQCRPWDKMNWDLPNVVLRDIWRLSDPPSGHGGLKIAVARDRQGRPMPRWDMRHGTFRDNTLADPAFHAACRAEESKAKAWFAKQ